MTEIIHKWVEEGFYDCCSGYWMITYSLYDTNGEWLDSVTSVDYIPMYYFLKDPTKKYDEFEEELEKGALPDYSHLYEVVYDDSIDYTMDWTCGDD